jgi:hypothetical protein
MILFLLLLLLLLATPIGILAFCIKIYQASPCYSDIRKRKLTEAFREEQRRKGLQ